MKPYIRWSLLSCVVLSFLLAGCGKNKANDSIISSEKEIVTEQQNQSEESKMKEVELNKLFPTEANVKLLGRTHTMEQTVWCALSASGIEFNVTAKKCEITFTGDNMASFMSSSVHYARVGIYLNGELVVDDFIKAKTQTFTVFESDSEQTAVVRVVKLSESSDSTFGIAEILTDAQEITPTAPKDVKIEFIGDSITCGYGVEGTLEDTYATSNENATKAYAYLTAEKLNADYSLVSYSGYGIISGYSGNGEIQDQQLVPDYYTKLGRSYGKFESTVAPETIEWDFTKFIPDIVVINLGTNDASYCRGEEERCLAYQVAYVDFLKVVREKNPKATILCTLGIMGADLFPYIQNAVTEYMNQTSDKNIQTLQFIAQTDADGYGVDYHPTAATQEKAVATLKQRLQKIITKKAEEAMKFIYEELDTQWIDNDKKLVAFAFDDGPVNFSENSSAMKILKTLEEHGQHATFFYVGQNINNLNKQEIEYAKKIGCEIGNHTWTHPFLTKLSTEEIQSEVEKTRAKLEEITGINSFLIRLPYLNYDENVLAALNVPGISCSVDSQDWNNGTYASVVERMVSAHENDQLNNAIILMHENYSFTADAVAYLVPYLLEEGYQIVSVSELAEVRGYSLIPGKVYSSIGVSK